MKWIIIPVLLIAAVVALQLGGIVDFSQLSVVPTTLIESGVCDHMVRCPPDELSPCVLRVYLDNGQSDYNLYPGQRRSCAFSYPPPSYELYSTVQGIPEPEPEPEPPACTPLWQCTAWSQCSQSGTQERECVDAKYCGTNDGRPALIQTCTPPSSGEEITCYKVEGQSCIQTSRPYGSTCPSYGEYSTLTDCQNAIPEPESVICYKLYDNQCQEIEHRAGTICMLVWEYSSLDDCEAAISEEPQPSPGKKPDFTWVLIVAIIILVMIGLFFHYYK